MLQIKKNVLIKLLKTNYVMEKLLRVFGIFLRRLLKTPTIFAVRVTLYNNVALILLYKISYQHYKNSVYSNAFNKSVSNFILLVVSRCSKFLVQNDYAPSVRAPIKREFSISSSHYAIQHLLLRKLRQAFA